MQTSQSPQPRARKASGAYYTPAPLVALLLEHALPALGTTAPAVVDTACGAGDLLAGVRARVPAAQLFGVDIDPAAVDQCRAALSCDASNRHQIAAADVLLDPPPFLRPASFDLVVGNPPFVNGIQGLLAPAHKALLREQFPTVRGAADLAHYFLVQAVQLVRPGGRIALVMPRAILNSPAAATLRAGLPPHLRPNLIYAPERSDFFPGAAVFVCLLTLGPAPLCQFSADPDPATARFRTAPVATDNWWLALRQALDTPTTSAGHPRNGPPLSTRFDVAASMTAADAYALRPSLIDAADAPGLKFVTTGLIEPRDCRWGRRLCRYLKQTYRHPRLPDSPGLPRSLRARVEKSHRPKILVAGLSRSIEAFLDPAGHSIGAVSTFSIYHPKDDLSELNCLLDLLLEPETTARLISHLGANGLRGRHITVKKSFLQTLPLWP